MQNKEIASIVVLGTLIINMVLFKAGVPQTLTCTIAKSLGASAVLAKNK